MLHAVAKAMHVGNEFDPDIFDDDWLHELSSDKAWLEAAETAVDKILKANPDIEKLHGSGVRDRYVPAFPLTQDELDVFQKIAGIIRANLVTIEPGSLILAARLVEALEALPEPVEGVFIEATFSQKMQEGGRGWASLYLDESHLRLEQGEMLYGEYGSDHQSGTSFQCWTHKPVNRGDATGWLLHVEQAHLAETLLFEDHSS